MRRHRWKGTEHKTREERGFTLIELLVVVAIVGMLLASMLPAVQAAREGARRTQCSSRLKQLALAVIQHEHFLGYFPPARYEPHPEHEWEYYCCGRQPSWPSRLLPYLEEPALAERWRHDVDFERHDEATRMTPLSALLCPSRRGLSDALVGYRHYQTEVLPCGCPSTYSQHGGALGDYAANHGDGSGGATGGWEDFYHGGNGKGPMISVRTRCSTVTGYTPGRVIDKVSSRKVTDGLGKTALLGEKHVLTGELKKYPYDSPIFDGDHLFASARVGGPGYPIASGPVDEIALFMSFGSMHPGACNFAFADGSVRALSPAIDTVLLGGLCNRDDGNLNDAL